MIQSVTELNYIMSHQFPDNDNIWLACDYVAVSSTSSAMYECARTAATDVHWGKSLGDA